MLGNKSDDIEKKTISSEKANVKPLKNIKNERFIKDYSKLRKMMFFETSAKTASHVEEAFSALSKNLMEKRCSLMKSF